MAAAEVKLFGPDGNFDNKFCLEMVSAAPVPDIHNEIRLFLIVRNEITRLPYLFSYYRNLGVGRFFVVDDRSDDGSRDFLLSQENCHVFHPSNSYNQGGKRWHNLLLDTYGSGHWCLVVDADELLVYPGCERLPLPDFCKFLDTEGSTAFFAFLLDMYPDRNLSEAVCIPALS